jgi:hypothetical protein
MKRIVRIVAAIVACAGVAIVAGNGTANARPAMGAARIRRTSGGGSGDAAQSGAASGPFATKATVEIDDANGAIPLKRQEQIAFMFMDAISNLEGPCGRDAGRACTLDELVAGAKSTSGMQIGKLKFDPRTTDPNYTYKITVDGINWSAWANPKKPGLGGFYYVAKFGGIATSYYNASGPATEKDRALTGTSINGDMFWTS